MYYVFDKVDKDGSGIIDSFEWLMYLDVERTEFNEKIFAIVDFDNSGEMDYREFCMCCWNYASATPNDLINLAFFLYSTDGVTMREQEIMKMLEHIYGAEKLESNAQARKIKVRKGESQAKRGEATAKHRIYTLITTNNLSLALLLTAASANGNVRGVHGNRSVSIRRVHQEAHVAPRALLRIPETAQVEVHRSKVLEEADEKAKNEVRGENMDRYLRGSEGRRSGRNQEGRRLQEEEEIEEPPKQGQGEG